MNDCSAANHQNPAALRSDSPPEALYVGLAEFNAGQFFTCHDTLETLWIGEPGGVRELYQGVIQIAAACHHLTLRANWRGAVSLLNSRARRVERMPAYIDEPDGRLLGIELRSLIMQSDRLQTHLRTLGIDRLNEWDRALLPCIDYVPPCPALSSAIPS